jgi:NTP pyrophosphatase (non-canonical NTP hydrolase)
MTKEIKEIARHYGLASQSDKLIEECAELIQAVNKYKTALSKKDFSVEKGLIALENLIEEIADVEIMIEQIKYLVDITEDDILAQKIYKINRTKEKIEKDRVKRG